MTATLYDALSYVIEQANRRARKTGVRRRVQVCDCGAGAHLVVRCADRVPEGAM